MEDVTDVDEFVANSMQFLAPIPNHAEPFIPSDMLCVEDFCLWPVPPRSPGIEIRFSTNPPIILTDHLSIPIPAELEKVRDTAIEKVKKGAKSFIVHNSSFLPIWMITLWIELERVRSAQREWDKAIGWLKERRSHRRFQYALDAMLALPWNVKLPHLLGAAPTQSLVAYCSRDWLGNIQIEQLSSLISIELSKDRIAALILPPHFFLSVLKLYQENRSSYPSLQKTEAQFTEVGSALKDKPVAFCINVRVISGTQTTLPITPDRGNHWTSVVIDMANHQILYHDPYHHEPPEFLTQVLKWWWSWHCEAKPRVRMLWATKQTDSVSCGFHAIQALSQHFKPTIGRIDAEPDAVRINYLARLLEVVHMLDGKALVSIGMTLG